MSGVNTAVIECCLCATESRLDDATVVRTAQTAAFVAAHRHSAGFAVAVTIAPSVPSADG